jgi:hypothetical protein
MLELAGNIHVSPSELDFVVGDGIHMTTSIASPSMVNYLSESFVAKFHVVLKTDSQELPDILSEGHIQIFISGKVSSPPLRYHYPYIEVAFGNWWVHRGTLTPEVSHEVMQAVFGGNVYVVKVHRNPANAWHSYATVIDVDVGKVCEFLINFFSVLI